jgi:hypothetical protein
MRLVLTDLSTKRWQGVNINNLTNLVKEVNSHPILGELRSDYYSQNYTTISLKEATHHIKDIRIENSTITGDFKFLENDRGREAKFLFDNGLCKISIRAVGIYPSDIHKIITWDLMPESDYVSRRRLVKIDSILQIITEEEHESTNNI